MIIYKPTTQNSLTEFVDSLAEDEQDICSHFLSKLYVRQKSDKDGTKNEFGFVYLKMEYIQNLHGQSFIDCILPRLMEEQLILRDPNFVASDYSTHKKSHSMSYKIAPHLLGDKWTLSEATPQIKRRASRKVADLTTRELRTYKREEKKIQKIRHHIIKNLSLDDDYNDSPHAQNPRECMFAAKVGAGEIRVSISEVTGRLYTPITTLLGDLREHILLAGEKTCILDIKSSQPFLLYAHITDCEEQTKYQIWLDNDFYATLEHNGARPTSKDRVKDLFCYWLGGCSDANSGGINDVMKKHFPVFYKQHMKKRRANYKYLSLELSNLEAKIMIDTVLLGNMNLPLLTIHDACICRESDKMEVFQLIRDAFFKHVGRIPRICEETADSKVELVA